MKTNKQRKVSFIILALVVCIISFFSSLEISFTYAYDSYSTVLEDLEEDENFDILQYPIIKNDYSLQVIQIAESESKELFVYVYQPSGQASNILATTIRFSTGVNENFSPQDYSLDLLSSQGTLYKYKVNKFQVKNDPIRYYDITAIFRPWDEIIDSSAEGDNTISEVSYEVGKVFTAETENGNVSYTCTATETIEITDKYVGFIRYENGFYLNKAACDSHFVAFSTDYQIDHLLEASVEFVSQSVWEYNKIILGGYGIQYGERTKETKELDRYDEVKQNVWWHSYSWTRIEKVSDFMEEDLTESAKEKLQNKQWVLRFIETPYTYQGDLVGLEYEKTYVEISDVTILRLKFETEGEVFNLGVVDNKQTGSGQQDNNETSLIKDIFEGFLSVLKIVLGIVLLILTWPIIWGILKWLFTRLKKIITTIFKGSSKKE